MLFNTPNVIFNSSLVNYANRKDDFFFIQIGANDGVMSDPINEYVFDFCWQGILIEPIEYYYKQLIKQYEGHTGLHFENLAIGDGRRNIDIFRLNEDIINKYLPDQKWLHGQCSFIRKNIEHEVRAKLGAKYPEIANMLINNMIVEKIYCISFGELLSKYNIQYIDLLQIDTQGFDYQIIKSIDFNRIKPSMINYESMFDSPDKFNCKKILKRHGYTLIQHDLDTFAYLKDNVEVNRFDFLSSKIYWIIKYIQTIVHRTQN